MQCACSMRVQESAAKSRKKSMHVRELRWGELRWGQRERCWEGEELLNGKVASG